MWSHPVLRGSLPILLLAVLPLCASAAPISAVQGEDIPLRGTAFGSDLVYLFLTGPNLPAGGISLAGGTPVATGDPGGFTRVEVLADGTWAYTWRSGELGRVLSPGTYAIYIALEPRSRPDLGGTEYAVQPVIIGRPEIAVATALPTTVESTPSGTTPIVTDRPPPATPVPVTATPASTTPGRSPLPLLVPLGAAALALLSFGRRR